MIIVFLSSVCVGGGVICCFLFCIQLSLVQPRGGFVTDVTKIVCHASDLARVLGRG